MVRILSFILQHLMFDVWLFCISSVWIMLYVLQFWAKTFFRAEILAEQIFGKLIFAILAMNRENKFREAYKI